MSSDPPPSPEGLAALLELEDHPAFAAIACPTTGILAWPTIRNEVFRLLLGDRLFPSSPIIAIDSARAPIASVLRTAVAAALHNVTHPARPSDVLIVGTGSGLIRTGSSSFNRYTDYFADALGGRAWTMEATGHGGRMPAPRSNSRLTQGGVQRLELAVRARTLVKPVHRATASRLVDLVVDRARDQLDWEIAANRRTFLTRLASRRLATYPARAAHAAALLDSIKPRLVLAEEASYGHMAVFNATCRDSGVIVAEFQHGMITRGHDVYNVAPTLRDSADYARTQPELFLSYGDWWHDQFDAPVGRKVAIGNPHREAVLRSWRAEPSRDTVVVLGDGIETEATLDFADRAATELGGQRVVFRPHPLERGRLASLRHRVAIDLEPDLYTTLGAASAVVAEASTGLFEAVGIVPRVFAWDTFKSRFYLGPHPFERVASPGELPGLLSSPAPAIEGEGPATIWADDWSSRFNQFLTEVIGPAPA